MNLGAQISINMRVPGPQVFDRLDLDALWLPYYYVNGQNRFGTNASVVPLAVWINDSVQPVLMGNGSGRCRSLSGGHISKIVVQLAGVEVMSDHAYDTLVLGCGKSLGATFADTFVAIGPLYTG
jgi:hypothetical protein